MRADFWHTPGCSLYTACTMCSSIVTIALLYVSAHIALHVVVCCCLFVCLFGTVNMCGSEVVCGHVACVQKYSHKYFLAFAASSKVIIM